MLAKFSACIRTWHRSSDEHQANTHQETQSKFEPQFHLQAPYYRRRIQGKTGVAESRPSSRKISKGIQSVSRGWSLPPWKKANFWFKSRPLHVPGIASSQSFSTGEHCARIRAIVIRLTVIVEAPMNHRNQGRDPRRSRSPTRYAMTASLPMAMAATSRSWNSQENSRVTCLACALSVPMCLPRP